MKKLRIGSYNIRCADYGENLHGIADEIKELSLDIIGLQECDVGTERSQMLDIPKKLAQLTGLTNYAFLHSIPYQGGYYGNAVLSAYPILSAERIFLPSGAEEQRALLRMAVEVEGAPINFFNTHLSLLPELRADEFKLIQSVISAHRPFILTGDFNIGEFGEYDELKNVIMASTADAPVYTFGGSQAIDNIIVSDDLRITGVALSQSAYSDHNMIYCEIIH